MKKLIALMLLFMSSATQAALIDRGNNLIYDDVLDVTWFSDPASARALGYDADGYMSWSEANRWVENLDYLGFMDWRLPDATLDVGFNFSGTDNELGYMHYVNLGNTAGFHQNSYPFYTTAEVGSQTLIWSNTLVNGSTAVFVDWGGYQGHTNATSVMGFAWAVSDGDIAASVVPIPATVWLFVTGMALLGGVRRRQAA